MDRKDILAFIEAEIDRLTQARDLLKGGRTSAYPSSRSSADYRTGSNGEPGAAPPQAKKNESSDKEKDFGDHEEEVGPETQVIFAVLQNRWAASRLLI